MAAYTIPSTGSSNSLRLVAYRVARSFAPSSGKPTKSANPIDASGRALGRPPNVRSSGVV
jgi:hypothetical protein